jgi:hypothetical protein
MASPAGSLALGKARGFRAWGLGMRVDRLRVAWLNGISCLEGVPREQNMLKGHLPRVIYHQVYWYTKIKVPGLGPLSSKYGTLKKVKARFWPWHIQDSQGQILGNLALAFM